MPQLILLDKDLLRTAIASNTDATEQDAAQIISTVRLKQRKTHNAECQGDSSARNVCEGMYAEKCDDVIGLCEALRAVLALAGESAEVRAIVDEAIAEHGGAEA
jgi:hypothetical protein